MQARPTFPYLCLLVSGGHNLLVLVRGIGHYVQLGTTLDDAIGGWLGGGWAAVGEQWRAIGRRLEGD